MPRNGSGTHSVPNTFSSGTTIGSSQVNGNFSDIASEITNSLPRDGQAAMTGQFKASTGTVSQPGISFGSDTNTGFYRKAADTIGIVCGGAEVGSVSSAGLSENLRDIPSGSVMLFYQAAAPTGWTQVTGGVHNYALRVVNTAGGGSTAGSGFTTVFAARTITIANMPAHTHGSGTLAGVTNTTGNHSHTQTVGGNLFQTEVTAGTVAAGQNNTNTGTDGAHSHTVTINSGATASAGSGEAMDFAVAYLDLIVCTRD